MASSASKSDKTVGLKDKVEDEPINGSAITGSREIGMEKPPIIERFSAGLSPNEVKRAWTYCCLKGLKEIELPASCQTWNDIYKNCRSLMLVSIVINEKGIADYAETLDFATTELHWPEVFTNLMRKILGAYPNVFKENEGDQVGVQA